MKLRELRYVLRCRPRGRDALGGIAPKPPRFFRLLQCLSAGISSTDVFTLRGALVIQRRGLILPGAHGGLLRLQTEEAMDNVPGDYSSISLEYVTKAHVTPR